MNLKLLFFTLATFVLSIAPLSAQNADEVLFTIDSEPVHFSEFERVYLKNIDLVKDESKRDIGKYFDLFVDYKLKLKEAKAQSLDKKQAYLDEFNGYKKQLAKAYLKDTVVSDALLKEAYQRYLERINASHILIAVQPNASPKDTLTAYNKINEVYKELIAGADFVTTAKKQSQDPSAVENGGDLGWFTVFNMVFKFEDVAYNTKKGEISKPFRTEFGYHVLKVNEREKTKGEVEVAHIMVGYKDGKGPSETRVRIDEINEQLKQGVSFESLAKEYSDDNESKDRGGLLSSFAQGGMSSKIFENAAFSIDKPGDITDPVKSEFGWHLIKLVAKHPPKTFEEKKGTLLRDLESDDRSKLVTNSFVKSLRDKYTVKKNEEHLSYVVKNLPKEFNENDWDVSKDVLLTKETALEINKEKYNYSDFVNYLNKNKDKIIEGTDLQVYITEAFKKYESHKILSFYENNLEKDNAEYAKVLAEYRDGLLLFDLMESNIWNASKKDTLGLQNYYKNNKPKYTQSESYKVLKASSAKRKAITKVKGMLQDNKTVAVIKKAINKDKVASVIFTEEELIKGKSKLPKDFKATKGAVTIVDEGDYTTLIKVNEVLPSRVKPYDEIKGEVINDFQKYIEGKWLKDLKEKFSIKINEKALDKAKKKLMI